MIFCFLIYSQVIFNIFRPPIDSVETKLDIVGLFNHCVTVKLADGSIIEQNIYPGSTHCQEIFLQSWKLLLNSQWNQVSQFIWCEIFLKEKLRQS